MSNTIATPSCTRSIMVADSFQNYIRMVSDTYIITLFNDSSTASQPTSKALLPQRDFRSPWAVLVPAGTSHSPNLTMSYTYPSYTHGSAFSAGSFHHHDYTGSNFSQSYQPSSTFYPLSQAPTTTFFNDNNDYATLDYPKSDSPDSFDSGCSCKYLLGSVSPAYLFTQVWSLKYLKSLCTLLTLPTLLHTYVRVISLFPLWQRLI